MGAPQGAARGGLTVGLAAGALCIAALLGWAILLMRSGQTPFLACCGPASVHALLGSLGDHRPLADVLARFPGGAQHTDLGSLRSVLHSMGCAASGVRATTAYLRTRRPIGILHVRGNHFVAVAACADGGVRVLNPVRCGDVVPQFWPYAELDRSWDGALLEVRLTRPGARTTPGRLPKPAVRSRRSRRGA